MSDPATAPELSVFSCESVRGAESPAASDGQLEQVAHRTEAGQDLAVDDAIAYVRSGDTVVLLGAAGSSLQAQFAQSVGPTGRVIGISGRVASTAKSIPCENFESRRGLVCDLQLDLELLDLQLARRPVQTAADWVELRSIAERLRTEHPLIAAGSVDCAIAVAALNPLSPNEQEAFFREVFRVLRVGGCAVIRELVSDEDVTERVRNAVVPETERIAGALREDRLLQSFERAGFHGIQILQRDAHPRHTVAGLEFRSVTVSAWKGKQGICLERNQALIYGGPFKQVEDDDGHVFPRGERMAVCDKTFRLLSRAPYAGQFHAVEPQTPIPLELAKPFDCSRSVHRAPRETKGTAVPDVSGLTIVSLDAPAATPASAAECCGGGQCC